MSALAIAFSSALSYFIHFVFVLLSSVQSRKGRNPKSNRTVKIMLIYSMGGRKRWETKIEIVKSQMHRVSMFRSLWLDRKNVIKRNLVCIFISEMSFRIEWSFRMELTYTVTATANTYLFFLRFSFACRLLLLMLLLVLCAQCAQNVYNTCVSINKFASFISCWIVEWLSALTIYDMSSTWAPFWMDGGIFNGLQIPSYSEIDWWNMQVSHM